MEINYSSILDKVRKRGEAKKQVVLYLPVELYRQFKLVCKGLVLSQVVEELIRAFLQDRRKGDSDKDGT